MQSHFLTWIGLALDSRFEIKLILAIGNMGAQGKKYYISRLFLFCDFCRL